jgi:hypothetical protein
MLNKLSEGGTVRNATYSLEMVNNENSIDARAITLYDQKLAESKIYSTIKKDIGRIQRSGYYENHPNLLRAGIGIACRYGRIWTPAHLDRQELVKLAIGSITKLDLQLKYSADHNLREIFSYYSNSEVSVDGVKLIGIERKLFDELVYYLSSANKNCIHEIEITRTFLQKLTKSYKKL